MIRLIEPGDCVYVRGRRHVFLVLYVHQGEVHQGEALVGDSDAWGRRDWVPLEACRLVDNSDE
jgi:hypothetical protein